ncbi:toprim domain-containing protein [Melghirimyces algeriensis]|uniref:Toprim-like n=1 Tax=Melghirimyces algeriensis TaxID=910412 RepID=A0A521F7S9_9BACL|nr:toprim domain-containing protein [Melghirimyces algeriensis]SMO92242.1 Toprim-like [Melghirimyces algeriensis]
MQEICIQKYSLNVDIRKELSLYDWKEANWQRDKLQACSPFRNDSRPSFYVWLEDNPESNARPGYWGDSGGDEYRSGTFVTLLSYLRQETEEETEDYLISKYSPYWEGDMNSAHKSVEAMFASIKTNDRRKQRRQPLNPSILKRYNFRHPYLTRRGINEGVQRVMRVGYDPKRRMVTIPWFNGRGDLVNIKYRSVNSKFFHYLPLKEGTHPVREHLFGIDVIRRKGCREAVICEAEIDAMYAMTAGFPALAVGGASFSKNQADIIKRSPIRHLFIANDNDQAGRKLKDEIIKRLYGYVRLSEVKIPSECKDLNDIQDIEKTGTIIAEATPIDYRHRNGPHGGNRNGPVIFPVNA